MSNLINATVYLIDGNPLKVPKTVAFDTDTIRIEEVISDNSPSVNSYIEVRGAKLNAPLIKYYVSQTVSDLVDLANENNVSLVQATIVSINDNPQIVSLQMAFPANKINIWEDVTSVSSSVINYNDNSYGATETRSELVTAANASSGGGGVQSVTGNLVNNQDPLNPIVSLPYRVYSALLTQSGTSSPTATVLKNDFNGVTFTWYYDAVGSFYVEASSSVFTNNKTFISFLSDVAHPKICAAERVSNTVVSIGTFSDLSTGSNTFLNASFEIKVYN